MLYSYFTEKLLGLKDVITKDVEDNAGNTEIHIEKPVNSHICPRYMTIGISV